MGTYVRFIIEVTPIRGRNHVMARVLAIFFLLSSAAAAQPYPPLGRLIDVGGYRVHVYCTGEGSPTVVIAGGFSFDWVLVQPEIAKSARVCTYDAGGTAWSDRRPAMTCHDRVAELHKLLEAAAISGPYVLVGYSIGGLITRLYASQYRADVAGIVIVDHAFLPAETRAPPAAPPPPRGRDTPPVLISSVPIVLDMQDDVNFGKLPERDRQLQLWAASASPLRPTAADAAECISELDAAAQERPGVLGEIPLVVVSTINHSDEYAKLQAKLLSLSHNSRQLIADNSSHFVEIDRPDIVVSAIHQVVEVVRDHSRLK
jgi:pimeloyl-ACP methyl ester carboxylesterase